MSNILRIIEESQQLLEDNKQDWTDKWNGYAKKIIANMEHIQKCRKTFHKWHPLKIYLNVTEGMAKRPQFSIRFKGQEVAKLVLNRDHTPLLKITKDHFTANNNYFGVDFPKCQLSWSEAAAQKFRKEFINCKKKQGKSEEHMLESLILDEMENKSSEKFKGTFRNVQPVGLTGTDLRFQMPVPLSANTGNPNYTIGYIDILSRVGRGTATKLAIMELKRDRRGSYKHAVAQSIIYSLCIQSILRNRTIGKKWWNFFGFNRALPQKLTLHATVFLPHTLNGLYQKEIIDLGLNKQNTKIQIGEDFIKSDFVFFQKENERIVIMNQSLFNS